MGNSPSKCSRIIQITLASVIVAKSMEKAIAEMGKEKRKTITDNFDKVKASLTTEKGKEIFQTMLDKREPVSETRDQVVKLLREGKKKEALQTLRKLARLQQAYTEAVHELDNLVQEITKSSSEKAESNARTSGIIIIIMVLPVEAYLCEK